jgi:hypothetical protein
VERPGPRNRRRLAIGVLVVTVIGVISVGAWLTRSGSSPTLSQSTTSTDSPHPLFKAGTYPTYGMTRKQVERITGPPTRVQGSCWVFRPTAEMQHGLPTRSIGSMSLAQPGSLASHWNGLVKFCFYEGGFSTATHQIPFNGQLVWRAFNPGGPILDSCHPCTPP